jgi:hypothetical protein
MIRKEQVRREREHRSGSRRRDQRDARLFKPSLAEPFYEQSEPALASHRSVARFETRWPGIGMRSLSTVSECGGLGRRSKPIGAGSRASFRSLSPTNAKVKVRRNMARNFHSDIIRKVGLSADAAKADRREKKLVRRSSLVSAITAQHLRRFGGLDKVGYNVIECN